MRRFEAGYELLGRVGLTHERPPWGIDAVKVGRREVSVHEEATDLLPFGTLLHFRKESAEWNTLADKRFERAGHH